MQIIEKTYSFGAMDIRKSTKRIILHHAAAVTCSPDDVHRWHKARGWAGIGYHFFVRKDGSIYRARPEKYVGAHAGGANYDSLGICFEGNYETEKTMPDAQKKSGGELVAYLKEKYGISKVQQHKDVGSTACAGKYFPFDEIANGFEYDETPSSSSIVGYGAESFVRDIQKAAMLPVTGKADAATLSALPLLSVDMNSEHAAVAHVQVRLFALGYKFPQYGADGDFGGETETAVRAFQEDRGIDADGVVGVDTYTELCKE